MKRLSYILTTAALCLVACADNGRQAVISKLHESDGVIYGENSVHIIQESKVHGSEKFQRNIKASAALIKNSNIYPNDATSIFLDDETVEDKYGTCHDFEMSAQMSAAFCSGVLVAPDQILTAAHCLSEEDSTSCETTQIVFGYANEVDRSQDKKVLSSQVYKCKKVLKINNYLPGTDVDYALLQLDRPVVGVDPVLLPGVGPQIQVGDDIYTVGYPVGTPKKLASGKIRALNQDHNNPQASLDVYFGNSGSPIFNVATNELVGILSNGEEDFVKSPKQCLEPKKCTDDGCLGEAIVPLDKIIKNKDLPAN